ncbi:zf-DHHC-domain-containing protein [Dothidotthia symphoricarpi CBS 119687]|uniref:Palmitoyltransferase PFA4 n=1 Tax=Dothidotthia symphoricarpi CBS 119687 TaxID=1392245 RepID=A0A6A6AKV6_9PLEO|nr:zf-DHHC-domain-containing protein [Dothidotthia symphoricarpi CBS 119687]KAF2132589.1 zf-DHHC-domain-containing protein [Dothidotthia symphoricarpi CBS 119687]
MEISELAVPFVYALILFLGYPSQWMLMYLEPGPLSKNELIISNVLLVLIFITYTKSVFVDPGTIPKDWAKEEENGKQSKSGEGVGKSKKWCRRCDAAKPPRAHHCKECKRCIPKMDHHCPWTANCVSHTTFPHFLRFLLYTTLGLSLLEYFLFVRISYVWSARDLPSYLGPNIFQVAHLFVTLMANSITLFAIAVLLIRNIWALAVNTTTIEGWEIERHRTLVRRARHFGGFLEGPDGAQVYIKKQEFPYDVGILSNIVQGMGTANPIMWLNPLCPTPTISSALSFPVNGFEDASTTWPPPDPDRSYRRHATAVNADAFTYQDSSLSAADTVAAFKARQADDVVRRRKPFVERIEATLSREKSNDVDEYYGVDEYADDSEVEDEVRKKYVDGEGEEGWRNSEGERLKDFGVDEDVEFYDEQEDEIPLSELIARRKLASTSTPAYGYS